jgi:DNA-binding response OmpR family regulator
MDGFNVYALLEADRDFLGLIDKARPHLVMLDFRFSGEECMEVCQEIKQRYPHLPVLALSCNSNIQSIYTKAGFDDYITKPFDLEQLYGILRKYIPKQATKFSFRLPLNKQRPVPPVFR